MKQDGSVQCWGQDFRGQTAPPDEEFSSVSAGNDNTCGKRKDGSVQCWGDNPGRSEPPRGEFSSISSDAGFNHTCGVRTDGSVVCWGDDDDGQATPLEG